MRWAWMAVAAMMAQGGAAVAEKPGQQAPLELERNGKWVLRQEDDSCQLSGSFGADEQKVMLRLIEFGPDGGAEIQLIGKPMISYVTFNPIAMGVGVQPVQEVFAIAGKVGVGQASYPLLVAQGDGMGLGAGHGALAAAESLTVKTPTKGWMRLKLGKMVEPVAALEQCNAAMVRDWGYDPQAMAGWISGPRPQVSPALWLRPSEFSQRGVVVPMLEQVHVRLDVDAAGAVAGCHVQMATKPDDYSEKVCALISQRAKFTPALDAKGQPVAGFSLQSVEIRSGMRIRPY